MTPTALLTLGAGETAKAVGKCQINLSVLMIKCQIASQSSHGNQTLKYVNMNNKHWQTGKSIYCNFDFDLVRYERCINAGMKPELVNATLKQVKKNSQAGLKRKKFSRRFKKTTFKQV